MSESTRFPGKGVKCMIIHAAGGKSMIRIHRQPIEYRIQQIENKKQNKPCDDSAWDFDDYNIDHFDFDVIIDEDYCEFVKTPTRNRFDYDTKTLGTLT